MLWQQEDNTNGARLVQHFLELLLHVLLHGCRRFTDVLFARPHLQARRAGHPRFCRSARAPQVDTQG